MLECSEVAKFELYFFLNISVLLALCSKASII
jgi:hypothetical protein